MPETETLTGFVAVVNEGKYGKGLKLKGREDWINESSEYEEEPWPELSKGDRIKVLVATSKAGKLYAKGEDFEIFPGRSENAKPGFVPGPDKDDAISWANALNVTATVLAAHKAKVSPDMVVEFARAIYAARPWAPQQQPSENGAEEPDGYTDEDVPIEAYSEDEAR